MHGTRTTAKILVGVAVAALSGCVSIESPSPAPEPPKEVSRPVQDADGKADVAPQIVEGPAREALEAALPPPPPSPRTTPAKKHKEKNRDKGSTAKQRPPSVPRKDARVPDKKPPETPRPPRSRMEVCDLGERYGGWHPGSDQAKICRGTYGN
ncbi:hypothetical protein ACFYV5_12835 [Streptomyces sp. NPDC003035]|uniref:hypothetical protein n=1 Tax=Streptomyces sp. NPDC003035 TaxID=3364676 RepID=UPI0036A47428